MNIEISLILSFLAGFGTLLGSILIFIPNLNKKRYIPLFLSISASIMLSFSILDLIPSSIFNIINYYKGIYCIIYIMIPFILGSIIINTIDKYSNIENNLLKISILSFISLILHNFPEGIATFLTSMLDVNLGISLSIGILIHNIPEGICIALPLYHVTKNKLKVILTCLLVSISEPIGAILAYLFLKDYISTITISFILLFVSGLMITLSINNIYKYIKGNRVDILIGSIIGLLLTVLALLM